MRCLLSAFGLVATAAGAAGSGQGTAPSVPANNVFSIRPVATFNNPWAMVFLPSGFLLVTEKPGTLRMVTVSTGRVSPPIRGVPTVVYAGQGGLLDIAIHPDFKTNRYLYLSYVEAGPGGTDGLAVGRGKFVNGAISGFTVIWRQSPKTTGGHYSARLAFAPDKTLFVTSGERQQFTPAQDLGVTLGKVVHLTDTGAPVATNPFFAADPVRSAIWSYGHRNVLGMAFDPQGRLWTHENGPQGGDEINLIERGANYGWPLVSNGRNYGSPTDDIPNHDTRPDLNAPEVWWDPSIAPSGMMFYTGTRFKAFTGNMFVGALAGQAIVRVTVSGDTATETQRYDMGVRIREVEQSPDGAIMALEDGGAGRLLKLIPKP